MDMLAPKAICPVFSPIVYEEITLIQIFMVGQNQPLMGRPAQVPLNPQQLI
jgi:hypothetical protein